MDAEKHERYFGLGEDYWWLEGKYRIVESIIQQFIPPAEGRTLLDAACGPGNFIKKIEKFGNCFGCDFSLEALDYATERGYHVFGADARFYPIKTESIDILVMLDVLEHIDDEKKALSEINRIIKKNGYLVMTVPAFNLLWGSHDVLYGHHRRYRVPELTKKLTDAGFDVLKNSYIEPLFFFPVLLMRKLKGEKGGDDFYNVPKWLNSFLIWLLSLEAKYLKRWNFPFGVSMICVAKKV